MSNRTAFIASAIAAGFVSFIGITTISANADPAAESECLSAPKATTPAGAHWYYRVEKGTKRKCWYLADEGAKVKQATETTPSPAAEQDAPAPEKMQKSVANARAELTPDTSDDDKSLAESTWPPLTQRSAEAVRDDNQTAAMQPAPEAATAQGWNIASRWPEPKAVASAENQTNTSAPEPAQPAPALTPDRLVMAAAATATPTSDGMSTPAPTADVEYADNENFPVRILLSVLVCALALAAIIGPMIFKYVRPHQRKDDRAYGQRRPIWDMDITRETVRQDNPRPASTALYADALPEPRVLDEAVDELEGLLARASRRPAA
jgi:hypothetical protein